MPSLTRQETLPSIHSWWSDSNSALAHSPTINLHAVAKPLMRRMYHRQALALIRKNRGKPLSGTILETYTSYFQWDFVLWSTKAALFEDLADRATFKADDARAVVDSPDFYYIMQMLKSPDIGARISSCRLLGSLAIHECTTRAILELRICAQLMFMLRDADSRVIELAAYALSRIACSLNGAQAIVDAGDLDHVSALLQSPLPDIQKWAYTLAGNLAAHKPTRAAVLSLKSYHYLVSLLRDENSEVVDAAAHTLSQIALSLDGAQAIVDARGLDHILTLLQSPSPNIQKWTCTLAGNLASHEPTRAAVIAVKPYAQFSLSSSDKDSEVVEAAAHVLSQIARSLDGAQVIVDARGLDHVLTFLESPSPDIRKWTCQLLGNLASHNSASAAVLALKPFQTLVTLLSDGDSGVVDAAAHASSQIALSPDGAQLIVDAGALGHVSELIKSSSPTIRKWTCASMANLAYHQSTSAAVLALKPFKMLMILSSDENSEVVDVAAHTLSQIALSLDGAQAIVNAGDPNHVLALLQSPLPNIQKWACTLVGNLAAHEPTRAAALELKPYKSLVSLILSDKNSEVVGTAVHALSQIARSLDGAQVIVDARGLDHVSKLLESPSPDIRKRTCQLLGNLAFHDSVSAAVLALRPFKTLATLLSDGDSGVVNAAAHASSQIALSPDGAQLIVDAGALGHFSELIKSPSPTIRKWTCALMANLAYHQSTSAAVLALKPFRMLMILLSDKDSEVSEWAVYVLWRIACSLKGAQAVVNARTLDFALDLLQSPRPNIRKWTCELVGNLAWHKSTRAAVLARDPFKSLVTLLSDKDPAVIEWAVYALSQIARWLDGAQAIVNARGLDHVSTFLESPSPSIRQNTCLIVGNLASYDSTSAAILALKPYKTLVMLLRDEDSEVVEWVVYALWRIARLPMGAQAVVNAGAMVLVLELLQSPSPNIRKWTCQLVGNLAWHNSTRAAVLVLKPYESFVSLLSDGDSEVVDGAVHALSQISLSPDGAQLIVDSRALDLVPKLFESPSPTIRKWTCALMAILAYHQSTSGAVLTLKPFKTLVTLLSDKDFQVVTCAAQALSQIARSLDGAQAIFDARGLDYISTLLESPSPKIRKWTCKLLGYLASHDSALAAVLALKPFKTLVTLLSDQDSGVVECAVYALGRIARLLEGARAVVNAGALVLTLKLLESPSPDIREWTCELVGKLASHEVTLPAILELEPSEQLVSCLREPSTCDNAIFALCAISNSPEGVAALADLDVAGELQELPETTHKTVQQIRTIMDNISRHIKGTGVAL